MLNCIIIDDEQPGRLLLEKYCEKIEYLHLVGSFKSVEYISDILLKEEIHIIFLDIQMPNITGIEFLRSFNIGASQVIFTTAFREYAYEGFELNAIDYLLKPIAFPNFLSAVNKAKANINAPSVHHKTLSDEVILLKSNKKLHRVKIDDIRYIKSENEYVNYVTFDKNIMVLGALKTLDETYDKYPFIIRTHRSYIVNLKHVDHLDGNLMSIGGEFLPLSLNYKSKFMEAWKINW